MSQMDRGEKVEKKPMKIIDYVTKLTIHEEWQKLEMYQNFIFSDLFIGMSQSTCLPHVALKELCERSSGI